MKFNKNIRFAICAILLLSAVSCSKSFFTNANENPQAPAQVPPNLILSTTEAALGFTQGGDISRFTSLLMQQVFGNASQSQAFYQYALNPGTFDNLWPDYYTSFLINDDTLRRLADARGYNEYSGVSRILLAYGLQVGVDLWGGLPFSRALAGNGNLHPAYDTDKGLYDTIANLVKTGIVYLNNPRPGALTPGADDVVYGGNAGQWIKFGHAVLARLYIHQSKADPAMAQGALAEVALSFSDNSGNAQYGFGNAETSANPWYQFNEQRPGDETFSNTTIAAMLISLNDPRYPIYIDSTNDGLAHTDAATHRHFGGLGSYYAALSSPVEFITYDELQFIDAEAILRSSGDIPQAQVYYKAAITANMMKLGVSAADLATYLAANGTLPGTKDAAIAQVATQEYLALYLNPEAWVLWRRTGSPALMPIAGNAIPRRLLYPQTELSFNTANTPTGVTLFAP